MDKTKTVTIDAAWFIELYVKAKQSHNCDDCKEVHTRTHERNIAESKCKELEKERDKFKAAYYGFMRSGDESIEMVKKERDALKAKLKDCCVKHQDVLALANRLAAAEQCIEKVWANASFVRAGSTLEEWVVEIQNIIRAYRETEKAIPG